MKPKTNMTATRMGRRCSHAVVRRNLLRREGNSSWVFGGVWVIGVFDSMGYWDIEINGGGMVGVDKFYNQISG